MPLHLLYSRLSHHIAGIQGWHTPRRSQGQTSRTVPCIWHKYAVPPPVGTRPYAKSECNPNRSCGPAISFGLQRFSDAQRRVESPSSNPRYCILHSFEELKPPADGRISSHRPTFYLTTCLLRREAVGDYESVIDLPRRTRVGCCSVRASVRAPRIRGRTRRRASKTSRRESVRASVRVRER